VQIYQTPSHVIAGGSRNFVQTKFVSEKLPALPAATEIVFDRHPDMGTPNIARRCLRSSPAEVRRQLNDQEHVPAQLEPAFFTLIHGGSLGSRLS
jgi:hypothetical protein